MKRIALFDVDSKIPNLALMKISNFHRSLGDIIQWYSPLFHNSYDKIYASKIFTYPSPNDIYLRKDMIIGGPGFNIYNHLPENIDHIFPDYPLYNCDYAMGYITKGCIRDCRFCIIPKMEGKIYKFAELEEFCNSSYKKVMILDNNILAYSQHIEELEKLIETKKKFDFTQGFDIRLVNKKNAILLKEIKKWKGLRIKFAFDDPNLEKIIKRKLKILNDIGISNGSIEFYVLIGYNTSHLENLSRINFLKERKISAFAMPFNKFDPYQRKFARWVNRRFYKYIDFEQYLGKEVIELCKNNRELNIDKNKIDKNSIIDKWL